MQAHFALCILAGENDRKMLDLALLDRNYVAHTRRA